MIDTFPVVVNEATAAKRRVFFDIRRSADGVTPASAAGGQPQISVNGAAWTNTGIGILTDVGNGEHYADITQATLASAGLRIRTRYKDSDTTETRGSTLLVVANDPFTASAIADSIFDQSAGVETGLTLRQLLRLLAAAEAGKVSGAGTTTFVIRNYGDTKNRISATVDTDGNRTAITTDLS